MVRWNFPQSAGTVHDVWLLEPGDAPNADGRQITSGFASPGDPPVSETLDEAGTWTWVCKVHSSRASGQWEGMVGTAQVTGEPPTPGSGVDFTEYRVDGGAWVRSENTADEDPFETAFTVSEPGDYVVEYRSTDHAGNQEATKSVDVSIAEAANRPPTIQRLTVDPPSGAGAAPLVVRFAVEATDPDADPLRIAWDFGDGQTARGDTVPWIYLRPGTYTATVTATDPGGLSDTDTVQITVTGTSGSPPPASPPPQGDGGDQAEEPGAATVRAPRRMTARRAIRRGLRLRVNCDEPCRARTVLRIGGERVGQSKRVLIWAGETRTLVARLDRDVRRNLLKAMRQAGMRRVTLTAVTTVTNADGARRAYRVKVTLRR